MEGVCVLYCGRQILTMELDGQEMFRNGPDSSRAELIRLIHEVRQGSEEALNELCARVRPELLARSRTNFQNSLRSKAGESDLVQEALFNISQSVVTFRGQTVEEFVAWASRILDNKSIELRRKYFDAEKRDISREKPLSEDCTSQTGFTLVSSTETPLESLVIAEEVARAQHCIAQLPERYRTIVRLRHGEDLSFPQIAAQLRSTEPTVKNVYIRAMEILEKKMARD